MSCMRLDRHFSALVYACYSNQLEAFQILYTHGKDLTSQDHKTFVQEWVGGESEQRDCLFFAVKNNNAELLEYLLREVKLGGRVND